MGTLTQRFKELIPELAKFGVVGFVGSVIDLGGAAYLHSAEGIGPMLSKGISIVVATIVTYFGSRFWTFRHRVNQHMLREGLIFFALNLVGLVIAEGVIAFTTYGLDKRDVLAYNAASLVGTGLGTVFRYFSYKKWVFLAGAPGAAVAAGEATVSGIVDPTETSEAAALLINDSRPADSGLAESRLAESRRADSGLADARLADAGDEHLRPRTDGYGPDRERLAPADGRARRG
jgi:putative flippase GtrA